MNEIDENLRNSFRWIKQLYQFADSFSEKVTSLMNEKDLVRVTGDTLYTTSSTSDTENWLIRAMGNVYAGDEDVMKGEITRGIELPFFIFRFTGKKEDLRGPKIFYGSFSEFEIDSQRFPLKWRLLRHLVSEKYFSELVKNPIDYRFKLKNSAYSISCKIEPVSKWIKDSIEEQEELIVDFAEELSSKYRC